MKKLTQFFGLFIFVILLAGLTAPICSASPVGIGISFSSKAYWDNNLKRCADRERGCCFHVEITLDVLSPGHINGTLEKRQNNELVFSFSIRGGILPETYKELLKNGYFNLDGDGTFSEDVLKKLGLPAGFRLSGGSYPYSENGDVVTVTFK
jgi:hypothetical protein